MMQQPFDDLKSGKRPKKNKKTMGDGTSTDAAPFGWNDFRETSCSSSDVTTVLVHGIPADCTPEAFLQQLEVWGLIGTYDLFYMPMDKETSMNMGYAVLNFVDPSFVLFFTWMYQETQLPGTIAAAEIQGLQAARDHWIQFSRSEDVTSDNHPTIVQNASPSQWAVNVVNSMLSPQYREQFRKTKMCVFHKKNRCEMGHLCPFAHSQEELQPAPDLAKTKLCYNYFKGRCADARCKFAHGSEELRASWMPYSPGVWFFGNEGNPIFGNEDMQGMSDAYFQGYMAENGMPMMMGQELSSSSTKDEEMSENDDFKSGPSCSFSRGITDGPETFDINTYVVNNARAVTTEERPTHKATEVDRGYALRVRGTFMEAMQIRDEDYLESRQRSWSDGDLPAFREAMDEPEM